MRQDQFEMRGIIRKRAAKQATVGLMLFHCDYAETTILIIIIKNRLGVDGVTRCSDLDVVLFKNYLLIKEAR